MMVCIGFYGNNIAYWKNMPPIALFNVGFIWIVFLICRYLKADKFFRAGISSMIIGGYIYSVDNFISFILGIRRSWPRMNYTVDGNIKCTILFGGILIGLICIVIGIKRERKSNWGRIFYLCNYIASCIKGGRMWLIYCHRIRLFTYWNWWNGFVEVTVHLYHYQVLTIKWKVNIMYIYNKHTWWIQVVTYGNHYQ